MEHKKKYLGIKMGVLLVFLLLNLVVFSTTCYAKTTLTDDEVAYTIDNAFTYNPSNNSFNNLWFTNNAQDKLTSQLDLTNFKTAFKNSFNSNNTLNFRDDLQDFFGWWGCYKHDSRYYTLNFYYTNQINFGKFDTYNHLYLTFADASSPYRLSIKTIDDNKNFVRTAVKRLSFDISQSDLSIFNFIGLGDSAINTNTAKTDYTLTFNNWNHSNLNSSTIQAIPGIITFSSTNSVYTDFDGFNFLNTPTNKLLQTNYIAPEPEEPTPDADNTGTITDNSGETTGSIDLSGIQSGLDNIDNSINTQGQAIIDNQTENNDRIIENQNNNTQEITDTLTQQPNLSNTNISSGDIERRFRF